MHRVKWRRPYPLRQQWTEGARNRAPDGQVGRRRQAKNDIGITPWPTLRGQPFALKFNRRHCFPRYIRSRSRNTHRHGRPGTFQGATTLLSLTGFGRRRAAAMRCTMPAAAAIRTHCALATWRIPMCRQLCRLRSTAVRSSRGASILLRKDDTHSYRTLEMAI